MRWHEITIHTTEEAIEMISNHLHELGAGGVSIEESGTLNKERDTSFGQWYEKPLNDIPEGRAEIKGYFSEDYNVEELLTNLTAFYAELESYEIDTGEPRMETKLVDEEDWAHAWKAYFKPIRVSERLTIKPTWEDYEPESPDELILEMDPGMAFGTGTHATTSLCLRTLEKVVQPGDDVIDVGTGSGILAVAAVKLGARHVLALDLDPVAVSSATENAEQNGLKENITIHLSDLLGVLGGTTVAAINEALDADGHISETATQESESTLPANELGVHLPVRVVVANILAEIIMTFTDDVYRALQPGGVYIASGIIEAKEEAVKDTLRKSGFTIKDTYREEDWVAIVAEKGL
ncbi:50S ribosomal protein L11 methyltransferase [Gorillibacterium timonense]|uniref:50S ribosomal protein L11 methyltransferase n=1 Tax=Gorillibacterium timonense TaxID=1689269 RepID=UPI00071D3489|nr:50S ribosomal protein L11 methyltransferase [Gorillibacterium timonense]